MSNSPRFGGQSARGRRISTDELTKPVSKALHDYDPEGARQRRLGGYTALAAAGGLFAGARGVRGIARTTRTARGLVASGALTDEHKAAIAELRRHKTVSTKNRKLLEQMEQLPTNGAERREVLNQLRSGTTFAARRRDLAELGGGAAGLAAAGSLSSFANGRRNRQHY